MNVLYDPKTTRLPMTNFADWLDGLYLVGGLTPQGTMNTVVDIFASEQGGEPVLIYIYRQYATCEIVEKAIDQGMALKVPIVLSD